MKKRFTDSDKWQDSWYMELAPEHKCFWQYILDNCDNSGVWKVNKKLAEVQIGKKLNWEQLKKTFNGRITFLNNEKWFINKFLKFQYGDNLKPSVKPHLNIIRLLESHNLIDLVLICKDNNYKILETLSEGLDKGYLTLQDKDKDKDKEKDILKGGIIKGGDSNYIAEIYPELKSVKISKEEYDKLVSQFGIEETKYRIENVFYHIGKFGNRYKSHYLTILSWDRKNIRENQKSKKTRLI